MKIRELAAILAVSLLSAKAYAATAIVLVSAKSADVAQSMLTDWKNEKQVGDKLLTTGTPEVMTADQAKGLAAGQTALVMGICDDADAATVLPVIQALYPTATGKSVEAPANGCPKLTSPTTKVATKLSDKQASATLTVVLFEGTWDKGETTQVAIAHVRDKDGTIQENWSQRAGTVLGGEACKSDIKQTGHVIAINRTCEGVKEIETKKLSLAKGKLKTE